MGVTGMEQLLSGVVAQSMLHQDTALPHVVYASSYDALHFRDIDKHMNQKLSSSKNAKAGNEDSSLGSVMPHMPKRPAHGLHGVSRLIDEIIASSYYALHNIPSVGLRFDAVYGPRGFGVPSTSVPIFHADRIKRTKRGVSPDVDLAETAVRNVYTRWSTDVKAKLEKEEAEWAEENEEEKEEEGEEAERRLSEVESQRMTLIENAGMTHLAHEHRDFVYVEDAVGAIITAMQYKSVNNSPTTFNIGSGEVSNLAKLADEMQELVDVEYKKVSSKNMLDVEQSSAARAAIKSSNEYLKWSAATPMKEGAARLLAWHMDRALPFFPPSTDNESVDYSKSLSEIKEQEDDGEMPMNIPLDGEKILNRRGLSSCSPTDDLTCLRELHTSYPCASECSTQTCTPSVFDDVLDITHEVTEGCEVVMYTMALGYDVEQMGLETEYSDGEEQEEWLETTVCTIAFVPSESSLVRNVIAQIPANSLSKRNIPPDSDYATKVKALSGRIAHKGWALILVGGTVESLTAEDMYTVKLSPARLFHNEVRKAMFVDENFSHTPFPEDVQFLASETSRGVLKKRTVKGPDAKGRETKYKLPEEPQRRAVLLVSPMRKIPEADGDKMPLVEITAKMMEDVGLDPNEGESAEIEVQRKFYTLARSLINSMDLRSLQSVQQNKLEIKDFIRSKWIVHHLKLEEGHQLRCEWYREHVRWGTHLDQLSFAYIMGKRDLVRKIITQQPSDTNKELTLLQQIIRIKSDAHEWYPIFSAEGAAVAIHHSEISPEVVPLNLFDLPDNDIEKVNPNEVFDDDSTFYVRIMSDDRMLESRRTWTKWKNNRRAYITRAKEKREQEMQKRQGANQR